MALTAYCPTCERSLYVEGSEELMCPVCSSPLEVAGEDERTRHEPSDGPQSGGAK